MKGEARVKDQHLNQLCFWTLEFAAKLLDLPAFLNNCRVSYSVSRLTISKLLKISVNLSHGYCLNCINVSYDGSGT